MRRYFYEKCKLGLNLLLESYEKDSVFKSYIRCYCKLFKDVLENKPLDNTKQKNHYWMI